MAMMDKAKNMLQISKGKMKEDHGSKTGDKKLELDGVADQVKGNLKQAGEKVKDAFKRR
jgi:uncharacterized protein YjbJ (UPF0337 family)